MEDMALSHKKKKKGGWSKKVDFCVKMVDWPHVSYLVQSLSRVRLCDPMDYSTPGLPVHHQLPEFTQTPVHWVSDAN